MTKRIQIVSLDVPYPPDYGGMMDVFYKIQGLHEAGVQIVLHCFSYGREPHGELNKYCEAVYYYPRRKTISFSLPYIVVSRKNRLLRKRLMETSDPVLLEGTHCTYYLYNGSMEDKNVWIRLHNIESNYYRNLFQSTPWSLKKIYYYIESRLLSRYEKKLLNGNRVIAISQSDYEACGLMGASEVRLLPPFIKSAEVKSQAGRGDYCLYHGNLSVAENERAAEFLIDKIFLNVDIPLIICGKKPSHRLKRKCRKNHVELIESPDDINLTSLICNAHIHVLPSFNTTGTKLKILHALLEGRFVLTNDQAILKDPWGSLCAVVTNEKEMIHKIRSLMSQSFTKEMIESRQKVLKEYLDPQKNSMKLIDLLFR